MLYTFMGAEMTLICSKTRLQIKNRTKLKWFGPIFFILGGSRMKVVPCYEIPIGSPVMSRTTSEPSDGRSRKMVANVAG